MSVLCNSFDRSQLILSTRERVRGRERENEGIYIYVYIYILPLVTSLLNIGYSYTVYTLCVYAQFITYVFINTYASISLDRLIQTFDLECLIVTIR